jgi:hypothetical protein
LSYQVFIERTAETTPEAARKVATAIAARYKIPAEAILSRLAKGRFRVKANLERDAADKFKEYLESIGALCTLVDASGQVVARSRALSQPPADMSDEDSDQFMALQTPPPPDMPRESTNPQNSALGGAGPAGQQMSSPLAGAGPSKAGQPFESGLSAASGGSQTDLGALSVGEGFQLASLDDSADQPSKAPKPAPVDISDADAFLPPEMGKDKEMSLEVDMAEPPAPRPSSQPSLDEDESFAASSSSHHIPAASSSQRLLQMDDDEIEAAPAARQSSGGFLQQLGGNDRMRFAVGIALALVIGFVPAHFVASASEGSKYQPVLKDLKAEYAAATTVDSWNDLDDLRKNATEQLAQRQRNVFITALAIWLALGAALAFLWFRAIRWERFAASG